MKSEKRTEHEIQDSTNVSVCIQKSVTVLQHSHHCQITYDNQKLNGLIHTIQKESIGIKIL